MTVVSLTPAGADTYVGLTREERRRADYRGTLLARVGAAGAATRPVFARIAADLAYLEYDYTKALKKALLMADWIGEVGTKDLESRYHVWAGAVRRIGEEYGWLVDAVAGVASASGWPDERVSALEGLAGRLPYGVGSDAVALARMRVMGLGRALVRRLVDTGLRDRASIQAAGQEALTSVLKHKTAAAALWSAVDAASSASSAGPNAMPTRAAEAPPETDEPTLLVDLASRRVTYQGTPIRTTPPRHLQRQALVALAGLAAHAGEVVSMTDLASEMQRRGRFARRLVTPEPRELRYRIMMPFRRALRAVLGKEEVERLVETIPGVGLRLNVPPRECRILEPMNTASR